MITLTIIATICSAAILVALIIFLVTIGLAGLLPIILILLAAVALLFLIWIMVFLVAKIVSLARGEDKININKSWPKKNPILRLEIQELDKKKKKK